MRKENPFLKIKDLSATEKGRILNEIDKMRIKEREKTGKMPLGTATKDEVEKARKRIGL